MSCHRLHIIIGVIFNKNRDKVLIAKRPDNIPQGGLWEFPGGKLKPDENTVIGLKRELFEELRIVIDDAQPLIVIKHSYPEQDIMLDVWIINKWHGDLKGQEGQLIEWTPLDKLREKSFPAANRPIITAIQLPPLYVITPQLTEYGDDFLDKYKTCLEAGMKLVQFRSNLTNVLPAKRVLAEMINLANDFDCNLLFNSRNTSDIPAGAHGIHLTSQDLLALNRRPFAKDYWLGASCHNQKELEHACKVDVDFAVLSPVGKKSSHSASHARGWQWFNELVRDIPIPVYALGGMEPGDTYHASLHGGQGVAMIGGIWDAPDIKTAIRTCMKYRTGINV